MALKYLMTSLSAMIEYLPNANKVSTAKRETFDAVVGIPYNTLWSIATINIIVACQTKMPNTRSHCYNYWVSIRDLLCVQLGIQRIFHCITL